MLWLKDDDGSYFDFEKVEWVELIEKDEDFKRPFELEFKGNDNVFHICFATEQERVEYLLRLPGFLSTITVK